MSSVKITKGYLALTGNCSIHNLFKWKATAVLVTFTSLNWKANLTKGWWERATQREWESTSSFSSYTNCRWFKWLANSFTAYSSSTATHNWTSLQCQYCALTNTHTHILFCSNCPLLFQKLYFLLGVSSLVWLSAPPLIVSTCSPFPHVF